MFKMGANIIDHEKRKISFQVFAYNKRKVSVVVKNGGEKAEFPMTEEAPYVYNTVVDGLGMDILYMFKTDEEKEYPDPYSHFQPFGVHGFSQLINHEKYLWQDAHWQGQPVDDLIIMEIHVGTFSQEGTFKAMVEKLDYLQELGVNTIELMPVTQTPGRWNWGYDGVNLFSVNHNYGTPDDLKYLVDSCHQKSISVILDVVYNHFGPEGNYLPGYGPYFTNKHKTPWGIAVNFDDLYSEHTRGMILDNVRYWLETYHFDGLRLDAVHAIKDDSPVHILQEISLIARNSSLRQNRNLLIIAESDQNNARIINPLDKGGYGMDAQWMDDFHHVLHTALTKEREGYYMDYGCIKDFTKVYQNYLYTGGYSKYWKRARGTNGSQNPGKQFVVSIQNHDQVGNRAQGDRLSTLVKSPYLKTAAGLMLFSAYLPLIFMGEEYGEKRPFLFFTDYEDPKLQKAVSQGRKEEFAKFTWENVPDPQDQSTFYASKLTPQSSWDRQNQQLFNFYRDLIALRRSHPILKNLDKDKLIVEVEEKHRVIRITRWNHDHMLTGFFNLGSENWRINDIPGKEIFNSQWEPYGGDIDAKEGVLAAGQMIIYEH